MNLGRVNQIAYSEIRFIVKEKMINAIDHIYISSKHGGCFLVYTLPKFTPKYMQIIDESRINLPSKLPNPRSKAPLLHARGKLLNKYLIGTQNIQVFNSVSCISWINFSLLLVSHGVARRVRNFARHALRNCVRKRSKRYLLTSIASVEFIFTRLVSCMYIYSWIEWSRGSNNVGKSINRTKFVFKFVKNKITISTWSICIKTFLPSNF